MRTDPQTSDGYLRIAVVQLDYLPAIDDALEDPLWTRSGAPHSLRPSGGVWPHHLQPKYEALRKRVRSTYVRALQGKLEDILRFCVERNAMVVILPEYSVPPECLKSLAEGFPELVIVAGSHHVTRESIESGTYLDLSPSGKPKPNTNVAPVLNGGRIVATVPKLSLTPEELSVHDIQPGEEWARVEFTSFPGQTSPRSVEPFGVLLCKDFIHQHNHAWCKLEADARERIGWLAVPALTPAHSTNELGEFSAHAREQSKRYQRAVALANWASGGGTSVYRDQSGHAATEPVEALPPGLEGVLIVDVDMALRPLGKSNTYGVRSATKVVCRGPVVYQVVHHEHVRWLGAFRDLPTDKGDEAVYRICDWLDANPPLVLEHEFTRKRSDLVVQEKARWRKIARFEQEFGDVVLRQKALPMSLLRASLARGAANEVESWHQPLTSDPCVDATHVAQVLREGATRVTSRASVSSEAQSLMDDVAAVIGPVTSREPTAFVRLSWLSGMLSEVVKECKAAFDRGDFEAAAEKARALADAEQQPTPELRECRSQARLIATAALANLGKRDEAKRELQQVTFNELSRERQIDFITLCVVLGELDRAEALLTRVNPQTEAEKRKYRGAEQNLDFSREKTVNFEEIDVPSVRLRIAALTLERGDFPTAVEVMKPLLQLEAADVPEDNSVVTFLWTTELACTALLGSAMPERISWVYDRIPLPPEARVELVTYLEIAFERAKGLEPSVASSRLAAFEEQFRRGTMDWEWLASHVLSDEEQEDERRLDAALSAAGHGDLGGARQLLESVVPEWRRRLLLCDVLRRVGDLAGAEKLIRELRGELSGRPEVETLFALIAMDLERPDEAIGALRAAREALPGVGQRLQLAKTLSAVGKPEEALAELAPLSDDRRPSVLLTLARIHDGLHHVAKAIRGYRGYLAQTPDASVQVRLAELLLGHGEIPEATATSWSAFQAERARLSVRDLRRIAAVQQRNPHQKEQAERVAAIVSELDARRADSPEARSVHAELVLQSKGPTALNAADFAELEEAGVVSTFDVDALIQYVQRKGSQIEHVTKWQRLGHLGLTTALRFTGETNAQYLERAFDAVEGAGEPSQEGFWFSPPVTLLPIETSRLAGAELLVAALEFTFLVRLDLVEPIRRALGQSGCLVMPIDAWQLLVVEGERQVARSRIDTFSRFTDDIKDADQAKAGLLRKDGDWVALTGTDLWRWLLCEGLVSEPLVGPGNSDEVEPKEDQTALPPRSEVECVVLDLESVEHLVERGELRAMANAIAVRLAKGTRGQARAAQRRQILLQAASELAKRAVLIAAQGEQDGWLRFVESEQWDSALPQTKTNCPTVFAEDAARALHSAALTLAAEDRRRIVVDNRLRRLPTDARVLSYWDWPRAEYLRALERLRLATERDIGLPQLVKSLLLEPTSLALDLKQLSLLGFTDALDAERVVKLHSRYKTAGGVNSPVGRVHLDEFEQVARCVAHAHRYEASQGVSLIYGVAIFQVWCDSGEGSASAWGIESRREFTQTLLDRLDSLDCAGLSTFETTLNAVVDMILASPSTSWRKSSDQTFGTRPDSPAVGLGTLRAMGVVS